MHDAAEKGDVQEVKRLLSTPANINSRTREVSILRCVLEKVISILFNTER